MDLREKILNALLKGLSAEYVRLEEDDGISGFAVSPKFNNTSSLDRQVLIEKILGQALTAKEKRQVLMIAGFTREEYETIGVRIRVHKVRKKPGGTLEILVHGVLSDAAYVRGALNNKKDVQTTEPRQAAGAEGILMSFEAKGTEAAPLTKARAIQILKKDRYIEVMPDA